MNGETCGPGQPWRPAVIVRHSSERRLFRSVGDSFTDIDSGDSYQVPRFPCCYYKLLYCLLQNDETPATVILSGLGESAKEGGACDTLLGSLGRHGRAVSAVQPSGPAGVHRNGPEGAEQRDFNGILSPFMAEGSPIIGQKVQMTHFDIFRDEIRIVNRMHLIM